MSQSLANIIIHLIFSTKNRIPYLTPEIIPKLHAFVAKCLQNRGCRPIRVGGTSDHVHILCTMPKKYTLENFIREIKTSSSKWVKTQGNQFINFHWQRGYGIFSVSENNKEAIINYIVNQDAHHKKFDFREELRAFLRKNNVAFDEKYIWD